jgi:hypothetical protein
MVITVVPTGDQPSFPEEFRQAFDIEGTFTDTEEAVSRMSEEGGLDDILRFLCRCQTRLNGLIGESVILVDFQAGESEEDDPVGTSADFFLPSLN